MSTKSTVPTHARHTARNPKRCECTCISEYQDRRYGKQIRLCNPRKNDDYACTVCGRLHK